MNNSGEAATRSLHHISYSFATTGDVPALVACRIRFLTDLFGEPGGASESLLARHFEDYLHRNLPAGTYVCALAKVKGTIVGLGGLVIREYPGSFRNPGGLNGYVLNMYTVPEFRNQGIGREILQRLMEAGRAAGVGMLELHATPMGEPLYLDAGFNIHPEPTCRMYLNYNS